MENMPKKWVLAHKRAEQAYKFLQDTQNHLLRYLKKNNINDLYDLHKQYVPVNQYRKLQHKYNRLKKAINQKAPKHEAIVGKAKIQSDHQQQPTPSIITQLKKQQNDSDSQN